MYESDASQILPVLWPIHRKIKSCPSRRVPVLCHQTKSCQAFEYSTTEVTPDETAPDPNSGSGNSATQPSYGGCCANQTTTQPMSQPVNRISLFCTSMPLSCASSSSFLQHSRKQRRPGSNGCLQVYSHVHNIPPASLPYSPSRLISVNFEYQIPV